MSQKPDEDRAIDEVVSRLSERFPTVSPEHIEAVVDEELHKFDGGRVRDFVPVLVERAAKKRLKAEGAAVDVPTDAAAASVSATEPVDEPLELDPMELERRSRESGLLLGDLGGGPN
ncbi:hypothetical protein J2X63_001473 [Agromyces sp. 3263]|uniref:three-helix bundle dimerization domain-containing protein n=1 Tax=Agromyces sp. 3263 TaxID=2817750 RepID=UPI002863313F|nr:hypothetical protein [Agromyces sp. 3263]MDR6905787.1 hypothetical protein [Agromyces sp. 3263]